MTTYDVLTQMWEFEPQIVIGCLALLVAYAVGTRCKFEWFKASSYFLGVAFIFVALTSPIDHLGEEYLFSAHMVQHMMLGLVAPVLMVAGLPESMVRSWLKYPPIRWAERILGNPVVALVAANVVMWIWHIPRLYDLTLEDEGIHIFEHVQFMITGAMLWWPVFKPIPEERLKPLPAAIYLSVACFFASILGIIFTIVDTPFYLVYANPHDHHGALQLIREVWGIGLIEDQKLGGAVMWVVCTLVFFLAVMVVMIDWLKEREDLDVRTA